MRRSKLSLSLMVAALTAAFVACTSDFEPAMPDGGTVPAAKQITISASTEQPSDGQSPNVNENENENVRRTALSGTTVVWSTGDKMSLLTYGENEVLSVTVSGKSKGLGIDIGATASGNVLVRYSYIQVTANGTDVTSTITSASTSSNSYKLGIYNSSNQYQYAPAGTAVSAQLTATGYYIPLVQSSSSSSSSLSAVVKFAGIQFSTDNGATWTDVTSSSTLKNGSSWGKSDVNYEWLEEGIVTSQNLPFTLSEGANSASGSFTGTEPASGAACYALYPYSANASFDGTALHFSLPEHQTYAEGSFGQGANPMAGAYQDGSVEMKNLGGALCLQLRGTETVTQIRLTDLGSAPLWGSATIVAASIGTAGCTLSGGSSTVILDCPSVTLSADEPTPFYIALPAGALAQGFLAEVVTTEGTGTLRTTRDQTIHRATVRKMSPCGLGELTMTIEDFNIENPAVAEYIANSTTTLSSTASNYSQSYFDQSRSYRPDQPNTKTITFANPGSQTITITMATDAQYQDVVLSTTTTGSEYTLRNFVPGTTYYYKATNGTTVLTRGALHATGQVRMIAVEKGFNIRDLGGWTGLNGNTVRYGQIYRGASLGGTDMNGTTSDITDDDKAELYRIGMRAQLDLRAATNSGKYSGEYSYHSYSRGETTLTGADFNNTMTDYGAYNQDASVVCDVAWIIYELRRGRPVYFNCRQGADRTGTVAFIIEGLLGCYGSDTGRQMGMDYELTGFSQANLVDNKTVDTSYRGATEAYGNTSKLFYALLNLNVSGVTFSNLQEKCYYYLNQYWSNRTESGSSTNTVNLCIDKADLDWFIEYMLGMQSGTYTHPTWATTGGTLRTVAEAKANVVTYSE